MPWWLIALGAYLFLKKGASSSGSASSPAGALPPPGTMVPAEDLVAVKQGYDALAKAYNQLQAELQAVRQKCPGAAAGSVTERAQTVDTTAKTERGTVAGFDVGSGPRRPRSRTRPAKVINFPAKQDVVDIMDQPDDDLDDDERDDE